MNLSVSTERKRQVIDITDEVTKSLPRTDGLVNIFVLHTTAAITAADLDPGTDEDLLDGLAGMLPDIDWRHPHDPKHAPDHLLSSIVGPEITVPVKNGEPQLGTWQRIILIEFDGPRERTVELSFTPFNP